METKLTADEKMVIYRARTEKICTTIQLMKLNLEKDVIDYPDYICEAVGMIRRIKSIVRDMEDGLELAEMASVIMGDQKCIKLANGAGLRRYRKYIITISKEIRPQLVQLYPDINTTALRRDIRAGKYIDGVDVRIEPRVQYYSNPSLSTSGRTAKKNMRRYYHKEKHGWS